ncbi:EFR1 family ferrodoxin [Faecalicatena sp. AGMB00832]|uniref:EFR1 family ferrodoxin n=1 Tax=Faecalicatena faecalis TaxID=2726362 RepID=A0ABS6D394_9FIRM|nr:MULTISPECIES: EFR1 family ferrodoxin [Faecalicatena]MBU3876062.1 EFR1 family ferrodoxin [Faecalicatena faecalis]MCI6463981.1 EFR1 family ferrodoxin [Faecalicatena sp.]MDY5618999.1 EFR1 family ferrodoxin [Lachnospiraceae bacterium]
MKMNELKLVYFSPTGTTRKVIMEAARNIELKSVSFDLTVHKEKKPSLQFRKDDFVLFGVPVYSGRVPETFLEYFDTLKGEDTPCALIATYGCRAYEDALLELKTEVENRGFKVIGAGAFPTEHSIIRSIGLSRPNKEDMKTIAEFGIQLNRRLKQKENFDSINIQVPGNTPYRKYSRTPLYPKTDVSLCTECGACAKLCPSGAISTTDPKKVDKKKCIACTKCVRGCKQKAKYVSNFKMKMAYKKLTKICKSDKAADIFL